jgi:hypothetical protein
MGTEYPSMPLEAKTVTIYSAVPAHNFPLYVKSGVTFIKVEGITNLTPSATKKAADTTSYDENGWTKELIVSRGMTVSITGQSLYSAAGDKAPGQAACELLSVELGAAAVGTFQVHQPYGTDAWEFEGSVNVSAPYGGAVDGIATWNMELTVLNEPEIVTVV